MRPGARVLLVVALMAAGLATPLPWLPLLLLGVLALFPASGAARSLRGLWPLLPLAATVLAFNGLAIPWLYAAFDWRLAWDPWRVGAATALRLATFAAAAAWLRATTPPRDLLPLLRPFPRAGLALVAALRFAPLLRQDAREVRDAQRARGHAPGRGPRALLRSAPLAGPLLVRALRRGATADMALRASGFDHRGAPWGPVIALTALAAAGRVAFAWAPNVSPTFLVVFLAGVAYGWRAGALVGALSMLATNLLLSGLHPVLLVNTPAMAALGALGGALRRLDLGQRGGAPSLEGVSAAGLVGALTVVLFSLLSDGLTFALFYGLAEGVWDARVLASLAILGLAFNALPAAVNAVLFAAATGPALRAAAQAGLLPAPPRAPEPAPP